MIRPPATIYVATAPIDLRLSFDRLAGIVRDQLGADPRGDALYVFHNRSRTHLKMIWHDGTGYCVVYNQPSSHYTSFGSSRGPWSPLRDVRIAAARSLRRSQRLQCFVGRVAGSS